MRFLSCAAIVAVIGAGLLRPALAVAQPLPVGFIETADNLDVRPALTAGQIQAFLPSRGAFTFPAPYGTTAARLTNAADCGGGDCVNAVGYAYWRNTNNHVGDARMLIALGLDRGRGGGGPTLFSYDKLTGAVTNVGPLFDAASPLSWATGEGWYFSATRPTTLYVNQPVTSSLLRYDVLTHTFSAVFDLATRPDLFGTNRYIWQFHSSADDRVHSATVADAVTYRPLGCLAYREDTQQFFYFPSMGVLYDECQIDQSGRWLVIKEKLGIDPASEVDNRIIDLGTGLETDLLDRDGAGGHSDDGFGYMVAADNWNRKPNAYRLWRFDRSPLDGVVVYSDATWAATSIQYVSHGNATADVPPEQQYVCGSGAGTVPAPRANEVVCFPLDGSRRVLVVAPVMTDLKASGGGDPYRKLPKGNLDVTGQYFVWTSNIGGDRLDAFVVKVPSAALTSGLSVSVVAPLKGAAVSGAAVPLAAQTTSGVAIASVQFEMDGAGLGPPLTAPAYSILWDTTTVADGAHVLTAVARDLSGNLARSSPVAVTVKNAVRVEETDPAVHAGPCAWEPITAGLSSGGRAIRSNTAGAQLVFAFTGSAVSWIGGRDALSGIANVYVDGIFAAAVDTFAPLPQLQATLFSVTGLPVGPHRLVIEATGRKQPLAAAEWITVDALDVTSADGTVMRVEESSSDVYTGPCAWYASASASRSGGAALESSQTGASVDFDFVGTSVRWIGARDAWSGIALVYVDGVFQAEVDTYAAQAETQAAIYTVRGLLPGAHRLTIQVTGRRNPAAAGAWVWVDAFEVSP